jgi:hypothetical protein
MEGPTNREQFLALPKGSVTDEAHAFFVSDDLIMHCFDEEGVCWRLHCRPNGEWFRVRAL